MMLYTRNAIKLGGIEIFSVHVSMSMDGVTSNWILLLKRSYRLMANLNEIKWNMNYYEIWVIVHYVIIFAYLFVPEKCLSLSFIISFWSFPIPISSASLSHARMYTWYNFYCCWISLQVKKWLEMLVVYEYLQRNGNFE